MAKIRKKKKKDPVAPFTHAVLKRTNPIIFKNIHETIDTQKQKLKEAQFSPHKRYWLNWIPYLWEFTRSIQTLEHAAIYINNFPQNRVLRLHGVNKESWMRYHVEMHLHEGYLLHQRLIMFTKRIERLSKRKKDHGGMLAAGRMRTIIDSRFQEILHIRHPHIHYRRYEDENLNSLEGLALLTAKGKSPEFRSIKKMLGTFTARKLYKILDDHNRKIKDLCTAIFEAATPIIERCEPKPAVKTGKKTC